MSNKKQLTYILLTLIIFSVSIGYAWSTWYWSSPTFTHSITVEGNIDAKTNFYPNVALTTNPSYDEIETVDVLLEINGENRYIWLILSPDSVVNNVFLRLYVECPTGASCTATVYSQTYNVTDGLSSPSEIGVVSSDGSDCILIEHDGDLEWITGTVWGTNYRLIRVKLVFDNSALSPGNYVYDVRVELGDNL